MEEQKPNYTHWDHEPAFTVFAAACLLCDIEPRANTRENRLPLAVSEMAKRLSQEGVQIKDTSRTEYRPSRYRDEPPVRRHIRGDRYVTREALLAWCERTNRRPPFLYPDERDMPPAEWGFTHDTELLRIARWAVRTWWEGKPESMWPTKDLVVEKLMDLHGLSKNEAEAVDLVTRHDSKRRRPRR